MSISLPLGQFNPDITFSSGHLFYVWKEGSQWIWPTRGQVLRISVHAQEVRVKGADPEFIHHCLGLEEPYEDILKKLQNFPGLKKAVHQYRGLRLLRQDPWECTLGFLNATLSSVQRVRGHLQDLAQTFGSTTHGVAQLPSPSQMPEESTLRQMNLGYRAKYLALVAKFCLPPIPSSFPHQRKESAHIQSLWDKDLETTLRQLQSLPGVGRKVASCIALYSLNHHNALPVDVWIERGLRQSLNQPEEVSSKTLEALARQKLSPWAGYGQQFLYQALRNR